MDTGPLTLERGFEGLMVVVLGWGVEVEARRRCGVWDSTEEIEGKSCFLSRP